MDTLSKEYKWYVGLQNSSVNEKHGYMEICLRQLRKTLVEDRLDNDYTICFDIPLYHSDENTIGIAGVILVTIQCFIMIVSIYPTERALKKHFNDDGTLR